MHDNAKVYSWNRLDTGKCYATTVKDENAQRCEMHCACSICPLCVYNFSSDLASIGFEPMTS